MAGEHNVHVSWLQRPPISKAKSPSSLDRCCLLPNDKSAHRLGIRSSSSGLLGAFCDLPGISRLVWICRFLSSTFAVSFAFVFSKSFSFSFAVTPTPPRQSPGKTSSTNHLTSGVHSSPAPLVCHADSLQQLLLTQHPCKAVMVPVKPTSRALHPPSANFSPRPRQNTHQPADFLSQPPDWMLPPGDRPA